LVILTFAMCAKVEVGCSGAPKVFGTPIISQSICASQKRSYNNGDTSLGGVS
jgi:hypothetical protein